MHEYKAPIYIILKMLRKLKLSYSLSDTQMEDIKFLILFKTLIIR